MDDVCLGHDGCTSSSGDRAETERASSVRRGAATAAATRALVATGVVDVSAASRRVLVALLLVVAVWSSPCVAQTTLEDPDPNGSALSGTKLLVDGVVAIRDGIGHVHRFDATTGALLLPTITVPLQLRAARPTISSALVIRNQPVAAGPGTCCWSQFGGAFAGVGSHILVGNRAEYDGQGGTGVVYEFDVHTGALVRTFVNPDPPASFFGEVIVTRPRGRVADRTWAQGGGDLVAIGRTTLGLGPGHYVPGSVELFDDATGSLIRRFRDPSPYATDQIDGFCGGRQPVTFAGPLLAVEANSGDDAGPGTGQIYLFDLATGRLSRTLTPPAPFNIPQTNFGDDGMVAVGDELTVQANYFPSSTQQIGVVYRIASATGVIRKLVALPSAGAILGAFGTAEFWVFGSSENLIDPASGASIYHFAFPGYVEPTVAPGAPIVVSSSTSGPNGPRGVVTLFPPIATCGNGVTEPGEQCDDANLVDGDGCDSNCTPTGCGNGIRSAGEVCDDGNGHSGDGCSADCTALCGNGITEPGEECDDGNLVDGDGCDVNCTVSGCGNGILTAGEACDDGNSVDGDGCSSACEPEALDVSGTWQVSTLFVGFQTTRFLSILAGSTPGSFTFGDASLCGTRAVAGPGLVATCPITSSNSTGTARQCLSLPDTGWYVDDVTLAAPAGDEGIIRLVENVRLVGRIEGQNGRAERITGREYRFGDDYDTSGALRGTGSASNPAILTMVMRRADAPVGTNVTVSPTDGATVTFAQVVGGGDAERFLAPTRRVPSRAGSS